MANEALEVGSIFFRSSVDSSGAEKGANKIGGVIDRLKKQFNSLNPTVRALGLSLGGYLAASSITDFFKQSIEAANESNRVMAQTEAVIRSTGGAAGYTAEGIAQLASEIQKTTPIADEAAQSGINMLLTFTNIGRDVLPQATQAMVDMATAMNGGVTPGAEELSNTAIQLGKALNDPVQGVTALRRVGVSFNDDQIALIENLVNTNRGLEAQKMVLNELGKEFGGSAAAQAKTFEGQLKMVQNGFNDFQESVGHTVIPALTYLMEAFASGGSGTNLLLIPVQVLATAIIGLGTIVKQTAIVISTFLAASFQAIQGNFRIAGGVVQEGIKEMTEDAAKAQEKLTDVWRSETNKQTNIFNNGMQNQIAGSSKKADKIKKDLEDETQKYNDELNKRNKAFEDSMAQMIWDHQDKAASLRKDIDKENADFNKSMADRVRDFKESMSEMEDDHSKRIDELNKDLSKETTDHESKTAEIQALIDKEESYGKNARQSKLTEYRQELADEMAAYNEKVTDTQEKIAEEDASFEEQKNKAILREQEETANLQAQHAQRLTDYQTELTQEETLLGAHADMVAMVKDKQKVDDIQRLINQHNEENVEYAKQHAKRMADIVAQSGAEGAAGGAAFNTPMLASQDELLKNTKDNFKKMGDDAVTQSGQSGELAGIALIKSWINAITSKAKELVSNPIFGAILMNNPLTSGLVGLANLIPHLATGTSGFGGGMALVGEQGPELVNLPRGAEVYTAGQTKDMLAGGQNIIINIAKVDSKMDVEQMAREIGYRIGISS